MPIVCRGEPRGRTTMPADNGKSHERKLAAILAADVAGYSLLMADDELATVKALKEARTVFREHIAAHSGRLIDTAGDSVLAEFKSVVEAVQCAVDVQERLGADNETVPEHRKMHFRIGTNLGDIIEEDDGTIYGDGVNVAARLEGLAALGGVMISDVARQMSKGTLDVALEDAGEHEVKNIAEPVRAWRVAVDGASGGGRGGGGRCGENAVVFEHTAPTQVDRGSCRGTGCDHRARGVGAHGPCRSAANGHRRWHANRRSGARGTHRPGDCGASL